MRGDEVGAAWRWTDPIDTRLGGQCVVNLSASGSVEEALMLLHRDGAGGRILLKHEPDYLPRSRPDGRCRTRLSRDLRQALAQNDR